MKRYLSLLIGSFALLAVGFQSCSSDEGNYLPEDVKKEATATNVAKKWTAVYFEFKEEGVKRSDREYYQKSLVEIELKKDGTFSSFDKYFETSQSGNYVIDTKKQTISLKYKDGSTHLFVIESMQERLFVVKPFNHPIISTIELVPSIK